jgi:hypothetical protein
MCYLHQVIYLVNFVNINAFDFVYGVSDLLWSIDGSKFYVHCSNSHELTIDTCVFYFLYLHPPKAILNLCQDLYF